MTLGLGCSASSSHRVFPLDPAMAQELALPWMISAGQCQGLREGGPGQGHNGPGSSVALATSSPISITCTCLCAAQEERGGGEGPPFLGAPGLDGGKQSWGEKQEGAERHSHLPRKRMGASFNAKRGLKNQHGV